MANTQSLVAAQADRTPLTTSKLRIGESFSGTIAVFRQAPLAFLGFLLIPLPFALVSTLGQTVAPKPLSTPMLSVIGVAAFLNVIASLVIQGGLYYGASQLYSGGKRFRFGEAIGIGFRRFFPLLGAGILIGLLVIGATLLLVVPGGIVMMMMAVAMPACIIETLGPAECMSRSRVLTKGSRWRILGAILLISILPGAVLYGLSAIATKLGLILIGQLVLVLGGVIIGTILGPFPSVLFHQLRTLKEGAGGHLPGVFD